MWAFKTLWDKGLVYQGFRVLWYCWHCEHPAVGHRDQDGRRLPRPAGPGRHRRRCGCPRPAPTSTARYALVWTTTPWTLPSNLAAGGQPGRRLRAGRAPNGAALRARRRPRRRVRPRAGRGADACCATFRGTRAARPVLHAAVRLLRRPGERAPGARRRLRHHRGRHRPRAHRARVRRGGQGRHGRGGHRGGRPGRHRRHVRRHRCRPYEGMLVFDANHQIIRDLEGTAPRAAAAAARHLRPPVPALLALRQPADPAGGRLVVRAGHGVPRPDGRAEPARSPGCPRTSRTASSASGWRAPATGRSPATGTGARRSRCGCSDDPTYPRTDVYGSLDELERDFGVRPDRPAPALRRRPDPAQPGRPDRPLDHAPGAGGAGLLVRVGLDAVRAGALPVRERGVVRAPLPGRLHRRVQRPDPRLVLHAARAGHGAVRPAVVRAPASRTASCWATTG